jgi:hypothetical protein
MRAILLAGLLLVNGGFSDLDQAVEICILRGLIRGARNGGLPLNGEDGHGRAYDALQALCREDHTRFNVEEGPQPLGIGGGP